MNARVTGLIQSAGKRFGLHITRAENTIELKRQRLLEALSVTLFLDVGAYVGHYARGVRRHGFAGKIVSFEPILEAFELLQDATADDPQWSCHNVALGNEDATATINVSHNLVSSSLFEVTRASTEAHQATAIAEQQTVRIVKLDSLRSTLLTPRDRVYLKIDVQGFEKQVLAGAAETLAQVAAIEVELSLVELYLNQTLMPEMLAALAALNFRPVWFERGFKDPKSGHLLQMDGIFLRNGL